MKILRDTFELAAAAAKESEVPLLLVGDKGIITELLVIPPGETGTVPPFSYTLRESLFSPGLIPVGIHWYGKVITKHDPYPGPGCNLLEKDGVWHLVDEDGCELPLDVVDAPDRRTADEEFAKEEDVF